MIRKVRLDEVVEVSPCCYSLATSTVHEPRAPFDSLPSSEEQAQNVLQLVARFLPIDKLLPTDQRVKVRRIVSRTVKSPPAPLTDVVGADDQDALHHFIECRDGLSHVLFAPLLLFVVRRLVTLATRRVAPWMIRGPCAERMEGKVIDRHAG
jgi:hypothetical protein